MRMTIPALVMAIPAVFAHGEDALRVEIKVNRQMELMAITGWLAGAQGFDKVNVAEFDQVLVQAFSRFKDHEAVNLARQMGPEFTWEALAHLATQLSEGMTSELSPGQTTDSRWTAYLKAVSRLGKESQAEKFFLDNKEFYDHLVNVVGLTLADHRLSPAWFHRLTGVSGTLPSTLWVTPILAGGRNAHIKILPMDGLILVGTPETAIRCRPAYKEQPEVFVQRILVPLVNAWTDRHIQALKITAIELQRPVLALHQVQNLSPEDALRHSIMLAILDRLEADCGLTTEDRVYRRSEDDDKGYYWAENLSKALGSFKGPFLGPELTTAIVKLGKEGPSLAEDWRQARWKRIGGSSPYKPKVVSIEPADDSKDVDPALSVLRISFDVPMNKGLSLLPAQGVYPTFAGNASWDSEGKVLTLPVRLYPHTTYAFRLNSLDLPLFRSQFGFPLEPMEIRFRTR